LQADDTEINELKETLVATPKLSVLELPAYSVEDVEPMADFLRQHCPLVKVVGCGDGDVTPSWAVTPKPAH
jgi:hypothetical protein